MPSRARTTWTTTRARALDEIEDAHRALAGSTPGRRAATQQLIQAYVVMVSSQFQGFCRDLHSDCVDWVARHASTPMLSVALRHSLSVNRLLDRGNPNPGNIGSDFERFGLSLWTRLDAHDARNVARRRSLESLSAWRNAIAHQDFNPARLGARLVLRLGEARGWRRACSGLVVSCDAVMRDQLRALVGVAPW